MIIQSVGNKITENSVKTNKLEPIPIAFLSRALGYNKKFHNEIDELYEINQVEFYNFVMQDTEAKKTYESRFFKEMDFVSEIYSKKVYCILFFSVINKKDDLFNRIIDMLICGWKSIFNYTKRSKKISFAEGLKHYTKKNPNALVDEFVDAEVMIYFFSILNDVEVDTEEEIFLQFNRLIRYELKYKIFMGDLVEKEFQKDMINFIRDEDKRKIDKIIDKVFNNFGRFKSVDDSISYNGIQKTDDLKMKLNSLFMFEGLESSLMFHNLKFNRKDIQEIIYCYFFQCQYNEEGYLTHLKEINEESIDVEEIAEFIINNLYLKFALREYKEVKKYYYLNGKESMFVKNQNLQNEVNKLRNELKVAEENSKARIKDYEKLQKENRKLRQQLDDSESNKTEIIALREFMFNLDKQHEENKNMIVDYSKLKKVNGVIVGGTPKWQQRMKVILKDWNFIGVDNLNFDENLIKNSEVVVIFVNYMSHALYYKIIDIVNKNNIKVKYISHNQNVNIVTNQIYHSIVQNC